MLSESKVVLRFFFFFAKKEQFSFAPTKKETCVNFMPESSSLISVLIFFFMFVLENIVDLSPFLYSFLTFPVHILFLIPLIWSTISAGRDGSPPGSHSPYNVHNLSLALSAGIAKF